MLGPDPALAHVNPAQSYAWAGHAHPALLYLTHDCVRSSSPHDDFTLEQGATPTHCGGYPKPTADDYKALPSTASLKSKLNASEAQCAAGLPT